MLLKRSLFTMLAAFGLVAVPELLVLTPKVFAQSETAPVLRSTSIASILPTETLGVILVSTQNDRWQELSQFNLFPANVAFPGSTFYPSQQGASFAKDIQPWLGDQFGVALLSAKSVVTISSVKDQAALNRYVDRIKASRTKPAKLIQYKGATILEFEPEKPIAEDSPPTKVTKKPEASKPQFFRVPKLAIAVLPGYFVRSNSAQPLQELLDAQGSLADNPKFQRVVQNPKAARSLATLYGKYTEILKVANEFNRGLLSGLTASKPLPPQFDSSKLDPLSQFYDTAEAYIWAEPTGLRAQFAVNFKQSVPEGALSPLSTRSEILKRLPEVNYTVSNSQNLALYWRILTLGIESEPAWKKSFEQTRQWMRSTIGVDDRDIFPWMNGEYAVFTYPTTKGFIPATSRNMDIALGLMVQTSDRTAAETALNKFSAFVTPRLGETSVQKGSIAGEPFTNYGAVNRGRSLNFFSHGWTNQNTLLLLFGGGSLSEFNPVPTRNLTQSANFKSAIEPFPNANLGYFYVNQGAVLALVNNGLFGLSSGGRSGQRDSFMPQLQESLGNIRSISGASTVTRDQIEVEGFLSLSSRVKR